jgi:hemolysin activation/secretion protein
MVTISKGRRQYSRSCEGPLYADFVTNRWRTGKRNETAKVRFAAIILFLWHLCFPIVTVPTESRNTGCRAFQLVDFQTKLHVTLVRDLVAAVSPFRGGAGRSHAAISTLLILCVLAGMGFNSVKAQDTSDVGSASHLEPSFHVSTYVVEDNALLQTNLWTPLLSKYTGANVSLQEIVQAATDLQTEYREHGYPTTSVAVAQDQITNGVVTFNVFQTVIPQVVVSGIRYYSSTNAGLVSYLPAIAPVLVPPTLPVTNALPPAPILPPKPATPAQIAQARAELIKKMAEMDTEVPDTRVHVVPKKGGPHFEVERYRITGNTILSPQDLSEILTNIDGAYGSDVSFEGIRAVVEQLQKAYRDRGYITVAVGLPQQKLTNATVKVQVTEGRLTAINVEGNYYFSSNNVMRALPSLHTNILLNQNIFQTELNRANANQDRQIYPVISPGPYPGTSALTLHVKDQLPLHAKTELNNQNSPGTPDLRVNASAVEDNLWQLEHSLGVQYGFSPQDYKQTDRWNFYDEPLVANYSAFYRLPLGGPQSIENAVESSPGSFGYDEATRQFNLPPPSGQTELNVYASRSTIDTGIETLSSQVLFDVPFVREIEQQETEQGLTINDDLGFQLSKPLPEFGQVSSILSGGLDYKIYEQDNYETNSFIFNEFTVNSGGHLVERTSQVFEPQTTLEKMNYLPLQLSYNANWKNFLGPASFGVTLSANLWFSSSTVSFNGSTNPPITLSGTKSLQNITGSSKSTGHWFVLKPSFSQDIVTMDNWTTLFRIDGQWASEPLISNEQFGIGGVNSVRGYHEGEIFGDTGWHVSLEEDTPPQVIGIVYDGQPLTVRGSIYMDGATAYLLDPQGRKPASELWGTGLGFTASVGPHWQAAFLFSVPMNNTPLVPRYNPYFNFALTAQF